MFPRALLATALALTGCHKLQAYAPTSGDASTPTPADGAATDLGPDQDLGLADRGQTDGAQPTPDAAVVDAAVVDAAVVDAAVVDATPPPLDTTEDTGGTTVQPGWSSMTSATTADLAAVSGSSATDVYAVGRVTISTGVLLRYDGKAWKELVTFPSGQLHDAWCAGPGDIFAVAGGYLLRHTGGKLTSHPGGGLSEMRALHGRSASDIYVAGRFGEIGHFDGSGLKTEMSGSSTDLSSIWADPQSPLVLATGSTGTLLRNDGGGWKLDTTIPTTQQLMGVWAASTSSIWIVGLGGTLIHSQPGGGWVAHPPPSTSSLVSIWGTDDDDRFVLAFTAGLYHYDGAKWANLGSGGALRSVWGTPDGRDVFVVGDAGLIYRYHRP